MTYTCTIADEHGLVDICIMLFEEVIVHANAITTLASKLVRREEFRSVLFILMALTIMLESLGTSQRD